MNRSKAFVGLGLFLSAGLGFGACATAPVTEEEAVQPPPDAPVFPDRTPRDPAPIPAGRAADRDPYAPGLDVHHYEIELGLSDEGTQIWGKAELDVTIAEETVSSIDLDFTGLAVWSVTVDGFDKPYEYQNGRLSVDAEAGRHRVAIRYVGTPDDGLILGANVHGDHTVFADNWPNRARFWFPSVDDPSDKATARFRVHAPTAWEVIGNGRLQGDPFRTSPGDLTALGYVGPIGHRTWTWVTDVEIPAYTMVIGAADFAIHTVGQAACGNAPASLDRCIEVTSWSFPQDSTRAAQIFARAADMVDYFTETVGPYPYEKLANVQSATRFGGMENSSAIFYSEAAIAEGRDMEGTVSHEIAHQWFGDAVTEARWSHLWLSEGFATYFGALFFESADGVEDFRGRMRGNRDRVLGSATVRSTPVIDEQETNLFNLLNENNYPKGGWVLHMLRNRLGDQVFFAGIRRFYADNEHGTVLTDDFRTVMEEASGEDLSGFFDQWLTAPGFPELQVEWRYSEEREGVQVIVSQVQPETWPTFVAPLTLEFMVNGEAVRHTLNMEERATSALVPVAAAPTGVLVDPDVWLLASVLEPIEVR